MLFSGNLFGSTEFSLAGVKLKVADAPVGPAGFLIKRAQFELPAGLGGARITSDGQFNIADGSVGLNFPNIKAGGTNDIGATLGKLA